jgi:hypothetical protein
MVEAFGTGDAVAEIGEQLAWLGAALRSSPYELGVSYCTPFISDIRVDNAPPPAFGTSSAREILCKIGFTVEEEVKHLETSNGQCWHNMFRNPVVVRGYPTSRKSEPNAGLEIPLNMMAGLARAQRANVFNGKLAIKGFSAMLVPTKRSGDLLIWHLLYNKEGNRISYLDNTIPYAENFSFSDLEIARHVVGWCSEVQQYAGRNNLKIRKGFIFANTYRFIGAADSSYTIDRSRLPGPHAGCAFENVSVSGGKFVTGGATFAMGIKDTPVHVSRNGYVPKLQWISKKFVVLWDEEVKRGWLVNGTSALLHLLRASLEYNKVDKFKDVFLFKPEDLVEARKQHTSDSAIEVLLNSVNMKLKIYPEKGEMYDEETRHKNAEQEEVSKKKTKYHRLEDRVEHFYDILEKIIDHQVDVAGRNGVKLKLRVRKHLEGWDFKDLATDRDPIYPRVATLPTIGKGWVDLARSIHAITLFGRGFGDIIRPADNAMSCSHWANLPTGKYYLATCISDVKQIMDLDGDPKANPMKLSDTIIWHNPDKIFEPCQCARMSSQKEHSDFVQVILPSTIRIFLPKTDPVSLEDGGAVIFGHNMKFKWHWKDTGDPEAGEPPLPSAEAENQFHDSGIGTSLGSSATQGSGDLSGSDSQLPPCEEASSSILLPTSAQSQAAASDEIEQQVASTTRGHENRGSRRERPKRPQRWPPSHALRRLLGDG